MIPRPRSFWFDSAGIFFAPDRIRTPRPARENSRQREGKDVLVPLFSSPVYRRILGPRWARGGFLGDAGRREMGVWT